MELSDGPALNQPCYVSSSGSTFQQKVKVETRLSCMYVFSNCVKTASLYNYLVCIVNLTELLECS